MQFYGSKGYSGHFSFYVMAKQSAGILLYRFIGREVEVVLVHPGGPFFRNKDRGWWTVPKGEVMAGEQLLKRL